MKKAAIVLLVLVLNLACIDVYYFLNGSAPLFTFHTAYYKDGGTNFNYGIGYQLVEWKVLNLDKDKKTFYYVKREAKIFPFFRDVNDFDKIDKNTFKIQKELLSITKNK